MKIKLQEIRERIKLYSEMTDIASVSRRYFIIGFFDGVLTILGLIIGSHLSGEISARLVITAGVATALALGISSSWGAFEAERIEQKIMKDQKEKALLVNSRESTIDRAHRFAAYVSSIIHGIREWFQDVSRRCCDCCDSNNSQPQPLHLKPFLIPPLLSSWEEPGSSEMT
ncbi:MAG: hypothetical protein XD48_0687 [Archaeoglobus fulgidus]|uniref:Uncharacterized protein n=1 Tax=Archaeoglobus fulgidus TaxID=2234 RepID=A0A101E155_ARCFL|nr:MAG: hypothetical protein XD48_0687 [Archaeoglobus fulgidus]